jgi:hypothetical protein
VFNVDKQSFRRKCRYEGKQAFFLSVAVNRNGCYVLVVSRTSKCSYTFYLRPPVAGRHYYTEGVVSLQDDRFNHDIDARTGYKTRTLLCMPIKEFNGDVIGVAQVSTRKISS